MCAMCIQYMHVCIHMRAGMLVHVYIHVVQIKYNKIRIYM